MDFRFPIKCETWNNMADSLSLSFAFPRAFQIIKYLAAALVFCLWRTEGTLGQRGGGSALGDSGNGGILPMRGLGRRAGLSIRFGRCGSVGRHFAQEETGNLWRLRHQRARRNGGTQLHDGSLAAGRPDPVAHQQRASQSGTDPGDQRQPDVVRIGDEFLRPGTAVARSFPAFRQVVTSHQGQFQQQHGDGDVRGRHPLLDSKGSGRTVHVFRHLLVHPVIFVHLLQRRKQRRGGIGSPVPEADRIRQPPARRANIPQPPRRQRRNSSIADSTNGNLNLR